MVFKVLKEERDRERESNYIARAEDCELILDDMMLSDHDFLVGYKKSYRIISWQINVIRELFPDRAVGELITEFLVNFFSINIVGNGP